MLSFLKWKNVWITDTVGIFKATFLFHLKKFQLGGGGSDSALAKWTCHCALPLPVCKCPPQTVLFRLLVPGKQKKMPVRVLVCGQTCCWSPAFYWWAPREAAATAQPPAACRSAEPVPGYHGHLGEWNSGLHSCMFLYTSTKCKVSMKMSRV